MRPDHGSLKEAMRREMRSKLSNTYKQKAGIVWRDLL